MNIVKSHRRRRHRSSRVTTVRLRTKKISECPERILEELDHDTLGVLYKVHWEDSGPEEDEWFSWEQLVNFEHSCASKLVTNYYVGLGIEELN